MCLDILTRIFVYIKYLYEPKHKLYCYFLAAFSYSFTVHRCRIKRHSQRHYKFKYATKIVTLVIKIELSEVKENL